MGIVYNPLKAKLEFFSEIHTPTNALLYIIKY